MRTTNDKLEDIQEFEKLGALSSKLIHDLSNDLTCLVSSGMTLKDELTESREEAEEELVFLMDTVDRMGKTINRFAELRRGLRNELNEVQIRVLIEEISNILNQENQVNSINSIEGKNEEKVIKVQLRWLLYTIRTVITSSKSLPTEVCFTMEKSGDIHSPKKIATTKHPFFFKIGIVFSVSENFVFSGNLGDEKINFPLVICQEFVRHMQGWIQVSSSYEKRAVDIYLPIIEEEK